MKRKVTKKISFTQLRREINRHFLIRVQADNGESFLVSLSTLCDWFDFRHGEHMAERALRSRSPHPTMRCKGCTVVFFNR